jgi:hypothetical protein
LKYIQENDKIKETLCKENNVPLYYNCYNDNVAEKMNEILNNLNIKQENNDEKENSGG